MSRRAEELRDEALALSERERADLAADLLSSLPSPPQDRDGEEWIAEIERRARAALAGEAGVSWDEARSAAERRLGRK